MSTSPQKRVVPGPLKNVLQMDIAVTKKFCAAGDSVLDPAKSRKHYKFLEYSCHGIPWIFFSFAQIWLFWNVERFQSQINFIMGILMDCTLVVVLKAFVRRRRPSNNQSDMFMTMGPDAYSFPSGHVSRAVLIAFFSTFLAPLPAVFIPLVWVWALSIGFSRIMLRRHFILDVLGGVLLGLAEGWILAQIWLSRETAAWLVASMTDEAVNLEGLHDGGGGVIEE